MHMKKVLSLGFVALLLLSMTMVVVATPWDGTPDDNTAADAIWIDPKNTTNLDMGDIFTVDVLINMTTGFYGFQYDLNWSSSVLQAVEIQTHTDNVPAGDLLPGWTAVFIANNVTSPGHHAYAVSATGGVVFTGVDSLCTYKFKVLWQPTEPNPDWCGLIDINSEILADGAANPIPHTTVDGMYCLNSIEIQKPKIGVDPSYVLGEYGKTFTVDIVIEDQCPLFAAWDMCGWEVKLGYNTTVLDALACAEGPFMPGFAGPNGTYPVCLINDTAGVVHMADLFLGNHTAPFGTGVLMTITFNATSMYTVPPGIPPHVYPLDLYDALMVDCASQPIEFCAPPNDGEYEEPFKILGWALDCWTDPYRKLNEGNSYLTPETGEGISDPDPFDIGSGWDIECVPGYGWNQTGDDIIWEADCYEPQEFVKLYAYLSYNEWPEQNKIVAFEIYGPCNPYHNISIIRTAITNSTGVATINFTIPHPCENLEEIVFGKWVCYQSAQVKDPWDPLRYAKIEDILMWDVGWKVELLEVTVEEPVWPCAELPITVYYKNIAQVPMWVTFTFTVFDTLLDPLGELVTGMWVEPGEYCHPAYGNFTVWIHIPKWCHVGPCAHVCVNAFTALPSTCGLPYCPEVCTHFTISLPP